MQQMQYHGIASYKLEYQLSTGGEWQTALDTTASTATSYPYTIEGLTGGTSYNLRVTVVDRAGNTDIGTNTATTKKPEKNPGGVITDITTDEYIYLGQHGNIQYLNAGINVDYQYRPRTATVSGDICGKLNKNIARNNKYKLGSIW